MFWLHARLELQDRLNSSMYVVTVVVLMVLIIGSAVSGLQRYTSQVEQRQNILSANRMALEDIGSWHSVDGSNIGIKLVRPVLPLATISSGFDSAVGRVVSIREGDIPRMEDSLFSTLPIFAILGELDMAGVLKVILSLFALLFSYNIVSGARERGLLKLHFSNSVTRHAYLGGRAAGSFISLTLAVSAGFLAAVLIIILMGNIAFSAVQIVRIMLFFLLLILFKAAFFGLGLLCSTLSKSSAVSFMAGLLAWVFFVILFPPFSVFIAGQVYQVPEYSSIQSEVAALREQYNSDLNSSVQTAMQERGYTELENPERRERFREIQDEMNDILQTDYRMSVERILDDYKARQENLTSFALTISRLSPASSYTFGTQTLLENSYLDLKHYLDQTIEYRQTTTAFIDELHSFEHDPDASEADKRFSLNRLPMFSYDRRELAASLAESAIDFTVLFIFFLITYASAHASFVHYDVR